MENKEIVLKALKGAFIERDADPIEATRKLLYEKCGPPAHGSVMFHRAAYEAIGGYRSCFYYGQDADFWLRLAGSGQIAYVPEDLYHARLSPQGISAAQSDWQSGRQPGGAVSRAV